MHRANPGRSARGGSEWNRTCGAVEAVGSVREDRDLDRQCRCMVHRLERAAGVRGLDGPTPRRDRKRRGWRGCSCCLLRACGHCGERMGRAPAEARGEAARGRARQERSRAGHDCRLALVPSACPDPAWSHISSRSTPEGEKDLSHLGPTGSIPVMLIPVEVGRMRRKPSEAMGRCP